MIKKDKNVKEKIKSYLNFIEEEEQTQTFMAGFEPAISQSETGCVIHYAT